MTAPFRCLVGALNNKKVVGLKQLDEPSPFFYVFNTNTKTVNFLRNRQIFNEIKALFYKTKTSLFSNYIKYPTYHWFIEITSITGEIGTSCPSGASEFKPSFLLGSCSAIFRFSMVFCR